LVPANNGVLKLGSGALAFFNNQPSGSAHLVIDVNGYFIEAGMTAIHHAYFPYGEELTPIAQDAEQMKFTGHERDLGVAGNAADDLDYMHARLHNPQTGRFLSVDPVLNLKRALKSPQNWNRYAYALGNPLKYVDPTGKDVSIRIRFTVDKGNPEWTDEQKKKILALVTQWYESQNVGKVYVFDAAQGSHGANFLTRLFSPGYATISATTGTGDKHNATTVFAGNYAHLPEPQRSNATANTLIHETAAHHFRGTAGNQTDYITFLRDGGGYHMWEDVTSRYGTVADSWAYDDPTTSGNVTDGPIPIHPGDQKLLQEQVGGAQVEPPRW
jgi:RHS repeat-associated protein